MSAAGLRWSRASTEPVLRDNPPAARLEARGLCCRFNHFELFNNISFSLAAGQVLRVRGANGSGKTTLLRILAGLRPAQGGEILWNGMAAREWDCDYSSRVCYLGHRNGVKAGLTVRENLAMQQLLAGAEARPQEQQEILAAVNLAAQVDTPAAQLSSGQLRRLALTRLLLGRRAVWILDEPGTALDRQGREWLEARLVAHSRRGGIAVIATHDSVGVEAGADQTLDLNGQ